MSHRAYLPLIALLLFVSTPAFADETWLSVRLAPPLVNAEYRHINTFTGGHSSFLYSTGLEFQFSSNRLVFELENNFLLSISNTGFDVIGRAGYVLWKAGSTFQTYGIPLFGYRYAHRPPVRTTDSHSGYFRSHYIQIGYGQDFEFHGFTFRLFVAPTFELASKVVSPSPAYIQKEDTPLSIIFGLRLGYRFSFD